MKRVFSLTLLILALSATAHAADPKIENLRAIAEGGRVSVRFSLANALANGDQTFYYTLSYEQLDRQSGEEIFSGFVAYARANYQYNRALQMRVLLQYNDFNKQLDVEPLVAYQLNPFTIFYVGATYGAEDMTTHGLVKTDRQYFMKFQYLIRK